MVNLNESMIMPVNGIVILLAVVCMWNGYRKGLLRSLLSLVGTIASFYLAWMFSENLSISMPLIKNTSQDPLMQAFTAQYYTLANRLIYFVILFLVFRIVCMLLDFLLKVLQTMPGYHFVSSVLGMILGLIQTCIWCLLMCVVLESPVFHHGSLIVNESILSPIKETSTLVFTSFALPLQQADMLSEMLQEVEQNKNNLEEFQKFFSQGE